MTCDRNIYEKVEKTYEDGLAVAWDAARNDKRDDKLEIPEDEWEKIVKIWEESN